MTAPLYALTVIILSPVSNPYSPTKYIHPCTHLIMPLGLLRPEPVHLLPVLPLQVVLQVVQFILLFGLHALHGLLLLVLQSLLFTGCCKIHLKAPHFTVLIHLTITTTVPAACLGIVCLLPAVEASPDISFSLPPVWSVPLSVEILLRFSTSLGQIPSVAWKQRWNLVVHHVHVMSHIWSFAYFSFLIDIISIDLIHTRIEILYIHQVLHNF